MIQAGLRLAACALVCLLSHVHAYGSDYPAASLTVGRFSAAQPGQKLPEGWQPLAFDKIERHTQYDLVTDDGVQVVRATSAAAASGVIRRTRIDPKAFPILQWRWKIANVIEKSDATLKAGDDYPARLYITFEYDPATASLFEAAKYRAARALFGADTPYRALSYIWERKAARGSVMPNPYTDWTMMVVVRNGGDEVGRWSSEARNVVEDYRKAFGADPPMISGVAIMTDTDNTGSSATAWYGDIVFRRDDRSIR